VERVTEIKWDNKRIESFWNGIVSTSLDSISFGKAAGPKLFEIIKKHIPEEATILDYGSGSGDLLHLLLENGYACAAYDVAEDRSERLSAAVKNHPRFLGHIGEQQTKAFDVVFCTEVAEHIPSAHLDEFAQRLSALVALGGKLILTTPNEECLADSACLCPVCLQTFHRWQHLNSFSADAIAKLMISAGVSEEARYFTDYSHNAAALTAWRILQQAVSSSGDQNNGCMDLTFPRRMFRKVEALWIQLKDHVSVARTAWRLVFRKDWLEQKPGGHFGSGSALIFVGKKEF
jgi:2-polyprenyl-3-methyl-5-hydroxy-6-metoxy-1,4-benzoquinol methylase